MNTQSYKSLLNEIPKLSYEQQLEILSAVISAMTEKKTVSKLSLEESEKLFNELTGCIKSVKDIVKI